MTVSTAAFLMFDAHAEEAMTFYVSLFADGKITRMNRYGPDQAGAEGTIMQAGFTLNGQNFLCTDANTKHAFTFTPAMSIFVDCENEAEIDRLVAALSEGANSSCRWTTMASAANSRGSKTGIRCRGSLICCDRGQDDRSS